LSCDIIVADETATFALPEVKVGLIAAAGGIFRLPKAVPPHIAKDMILTGRRCRKSHGKGQGHCRENMRRQSDGCILISRDDE